MHKVFLPVAQPPSGGMLQMAHQSAMRAAESGSTHIQAGFLTTLDEGREFQIHRGYVYDPFRGEVLMMANNPSGLRDYGHIEALASELGIEFERHLPRLDRVEQAYPTSMFAIDAGDYYFRLGFRNPGSAGECAGAGQACTSVRYIARNLGKPVNLQFSGEGVMPVHASWYVPEETEQHAKYSRTGTPLDNFPEPAFTRCYATVSFTTDKGLGARDGAPVQFLDCDYDAGYADFGGELAGAVAGALGIKLTGQDNTCVAYR